MAANPNPTRITDAEWRLWEQSLLIIPGVRLGGVYANKSGYHNFVYANQANWPGNYSIRLAIDLSGDLTKARAIDLTMSTSEMTKRTGFLRAAALHPSDDRLSCAREFYGTLNGTVVYGLIHDGPGQNWRSSTSDSSHLWHIHISFFTLYCDDWPAAPGVPGLEAVLSVLSGESWEAWKIRKAGGPGPVPPGEDDMGVFCKQGETNDNVAALQGLLQLFNPAVTADRIYGPATSAALKSALATVGYVGGVPDGSVYWAGEYAHLQQAVAKKFGTGQKGDKGDPGEDGKDGVDGQDGIGVGSAVQITGEVTQVTP